MSTIPYIETTEVLVDYLVSSLKPESGKPLSRDDAMSILRAIANGIEDGESVSYIAEVILGGIPEDAVRVCLPVVSIMLGHPLPNRGAPVAPADVTPSRPDAVTPTHGTFDVPPVTFSRPVVTPSRPDDEQTILDAIDRLKAELGSIPVEVALLRKSMEFTLPTEIARLKESIKVTLPSEITRLKKSIQVTLPNEIRQLRDRRSTISSEILRLQDLLSTLRAELTPKQVDGIKRVRGKARAKPYYHFGQFTPNARKALIKRAAGDLELVGAQAPNEGPRGLANKYARLRFNVETIAWQLQFDIERGATASMLKEDNPAYSRGGIQDAIKIVDRAIEIAMSEASEVLLQVPTGPGVRIQKSNTDANVAHTPIDAPQQPAILQP